MARPRTALRDTDRAAVTVETREPAHGHARTPPPTAGAATRNATAGDGRAPGDNPMTRGACNRKRKRIGGVRGWNGNVRRDRDRDATGSGVWGKWLAGRGGAVLDSAARSLTQRRVMKRMRHRGARTARSSWRMAAGVNLCGGGRLPGAVEGARRRGHATAPSAEGGELNANGTAERSGPL